MSVEGFKKRDNHIFWGNQPRSKGSRDMSKYFHILQYEEGRQVTLYVHYNHAFEKSAQNSSQKMAAQIHKGKWFVNNHLFWLAQFSWD